jgi:hypothetical protein
MGPVAATAFAALAISNAISSGFSIEVLQLLMIFHKFQNFCSIKLLKVLLIMEEEFQPYKHMHQLYNPDTGNPTMDAYMRRLRVNLGLPV